MDLAGSESLGKSGAVDEQAKQAGTINQGLLVLRRVVDALAAKQAFIPYRDSKLTLLLQVKCQLCALVVVGFRFHFVSRLKACIGIERTVLSPAPKLLFAGVLGSKCAT